MRFTITKTGKEAFKADITKGTNKVEAVVTLHSFHDCSQGYQWHVNTALESSEINASYDSFYINRATRLNEKPTIAAKLAKGLDLTPNELADIESKLNTLTTMLVYNSTRMNAQKHFEAWYNGIELKQGLTKLMNRLSA